MKRILVRAATPAILLVLAGVGGVVSTFGGCLPSPDISGLPAYEGGTTTTADAAPIVIDEAGTGDSTVSFEGGGTTDTGAGDSAVPTGSISGVVIDYAQGNGQGVLPGASISVSVIGGTAAALTTTSALDGTFTIPKVPTGTVQIIVTKASNAPAGVPTGTAYSSTEVVATVSSGQTLSVFPVLHEGCFQVVSVNGGGEDAGEDAGGTTTPGVVTMSSACGRTGSWAQMTFDATAFINPITGSLYSGSVRIEMIPLAYPSTSGVTDLSWALGIPGKASPLDVVGAAEYRVIAVDPGAKDDGVALSIRTAIPSPVTISVPMYTTPASTPAASSYDPVMAQWTAQPNVIPGATQTVVEDMGTITMTYVNMPIPSFGWWAVSTPATTTGCITGTVESAGTGVAGVLVHAVGTNLLGSSTAVTAANGSFCLDVQGSSEAGAATLSLSAGYVSSGLAYVTPKGGTAAALSALSTGTCASGTGCTPLPAPVTLTVGVTCISGSIASDAGATIPTALNVETENIQVSNAAQAAGISTSAYLGQISLGTGDAFCALAPPGSAIQLQDPAGTGCAAPWSGGNAENLGVPTGANDAVCATCNDAIGGLQYGCPPGP